MMEQKEKLEEKDYNISFFKPTTPLAKFNRNLILGLFSVWAVSIFGFQIWLRIIEKPTPEKAYKQYEMVWENIKTEKASIAEKQVYIQSALSVLGKVTLKENDRFFLNSSVNKLTNELVPDSEKNSFETKLNAFKDKEFGDEGYQDLKNDLSITIAQYIGVEAYSLEAKLIPLELVAAQSSKINIAEIEAVMSKYLIHNQSYLTDFIFLGFPFHYFYTSVYLLLLFVGLCLYYCIATDRAMKRLGIEEE